VGPGKPETPEHDNHTDRQQHTGKELLTPMTHVLSLSDTARRLNLAVPVAKQRADTTAYPEAVLSELAARALGSSWEASPSRSPVRR
jgi:hypothetical protein